MAASRSSLTKQASSLSATKYEGLLDDSGKVPAADTAA